MSKVIVDASVCGAMVIGQSGVQYAQRILDHLREKQGMVPDVWRYEVCNMLLVALRHGALRAVDLYPSWEQLVRLRLVTVHMDVGPGLVDFARQRGLSIYDAAYLQLARQERAPLATLDKRLAAAAIDAGIDVLA